ncbi:MAG: hypothetical protein H7330_01440, partial [Hymenobacteraceae bacterium]|nr:hypothetical protein [Hymenobacteraceae bacterium]
AACLLDQLAPGAPTRCALTVTGAPVRKTAVAPPAATTAPSSESAWRYAGGGTNGNESGHLPRAA